VALIGGPANFPGTPEQVAICSCRLDTWYAAGLKRSASNDIHVNGYEHLYTSQIGNFRKSVSGRPDRSTHQPRFSRRAQR
jgi:hypothetical protein